MTDSPASPRPLDVLKDAFLRNAILTGGRAFELRETILADEAEPAADAVVGRKNKTEPAESRA